MATFDPRVIVKRKPEIVVCDENAVSYVSNGAAGTIALRASADAASIVHITIDGETTLAEGGVVSIAKTFNDLVRDLTSRPAWMECLRNAGRRPLAASIAAAIGVSALFLAYGGWRPQPSGKFDQSSHSELGIPSAAQLPDISQIAKLNEEIIRRRSALTGQDVGRVSGPTTQDATPKGSFMIPDQLPPITNEEKASDGKPATMLDGPGGADARRERAKEGHEKPKAFESTTHTTASSSTEASRPEPKETSEPPKTDSGKETPRKVTDADVEDSANAPLPKVNQAAINAAISDLIGKGMTTDEALRLLTQLQDIGNKSEEVTPDMLAGLPHEVAQVLFEAGVVSNSEAATDAKKAVPYSIIRLPESIMEKYRGKDGIATIPERNSWVSTGNSVSLPLPGGGDINTAEVFKDFGLTP